MDRKYVMTALGYAIVGVALGIHMAATSNYGQMVTHAHILLVGFVLSFIYGVCHKLWLNEPSAKLSKIQYYLHQLGVLGLVVSFFLIYGGFVERITVAALLAVSSIAVFVGLVMMKVMVIKSK